MKKICVLSGAGMSAESGIATFRDANGLWEGHDVMEVASPEGFQKNPELVLEFYNQRRRNLLNVKPNTGHNILADLQKDFEVQIITQNVDDLHERAGSKNVLHLHGELLKVRSAGKDKTPIVWKKDLHLGDLCKDGYQLRPHIVWFGEMVPALEKAIPFCLAADIFVVIGTSLLVYPAASLVNYTKNDAIKYIIDPKIPSLPNNSFLKIEKGAIEGTQILKNMLYEI